MTDFTALLQQGNAWFFIPSAILLGALHGLEPGHSKTMMAAFIIAIKGTVRQAIMLGLAATVSHTAIVWLIAFGGMYISNKFTAESVEPWLQMISAAIILTTAVWMIWRTWRGEKLWQLEQGHHHSHDETRIIETTEGSIELSIDEEGTGPYWRLRTLGGTPWKVHHLSLITEREFGDSQTFWFEEQNGDMLSTLPIPEPHDFQVRLTYSPDNDTQEYSLEFHEHDHHHSTPDGLDDSSQEYQDAHALAHANDIKRRFITAKVTNFQILLFGLTGGLIPCPAAITVLLICIQLKALTLGATLVVCFSIGLALTLVSVGVGAAISIHQAAKRWSGFNSIARRAPYLSGMLIFAVGIYMGIHGYSALHH
ncbi:nickel/cobalt efflux protein RcnA [Limnobaculum xujianqingii]|uniref:nickel/cobalt efflux protein RcnA n=1 Tax=Limnobaculum xujianqingii TaxID=2738837 RepID=UPI00112E8C6F|nr:nickel/cobalt efflux protein RcnA [Limnobaculum xujianqingii]